MQSMVHTYTEAKFWDIILYTGVILSQPISLNMYLTFIKYNINKRLLFSIYLIALCFLPINFIPSLRVYFIRDINHYYQFRYIASPGILWFLIVGFAGCLASFGIIKVWKAMRNSSYSAKNKYRYLFLSYLLMIVAGSFYFLLVLKFYILPIDNALMIIFASIIAYAILKYRLMDIRVAVTRAGVFFVVYTLVLGLPFWFGFKTGLWVWAMIFMSILATTGPFIYTYLRQRAEDAILNAQRQYQRELKAFVKEVAQIRELNTLFDTISKRISKIINSEFLAVYVFSKENNSYTLKQEYIKEPLEKKGISFMKSIPVDSSIVKALSKDKKITFFELIKDNNFPNIPHETLSIPFIVNDGLFSFLILGPKVNKTMYNREDLETFEILSVQASLAIENCIFWQEEKTRLMKEEQIRRMQAMDHFSASMAHEIDNPIMAVNGQLHLIKLLLSNKFKERLPPEDLEELSDYADSTINNLGRISKMIKAIREFSKQNTGEFSILDMEETADFALSIAGPQIKYEKVNFNKEIELGITVKGNKIYLSEALINLIVNSLHAVKGKPDWQGEISLKVKKNKNKGLMELSDNGYGIKKELLEDIFLDFVTTKGSQEGTGMGLARVRKIIELHKGRTWAESEGENKGTSFFVELPLNS